MRGTNTLMGRRWKMENNTEIKEAALSPDGRYFFPLPKISTLLNHYCFSVSTGKAPWLLSIGWV